ncbi:MAG: hypothetical protein RR162_01170 [Oscillospiraceae bacterium]
MFKFEEVAVINTLFSKPDKSLFLEKLGSTMDNCKEPEMLNILSGLFEKISLFSDKEIIKLYEDRLNYNL